MSDTLPQTPWAYEAKSGTVRSAAGEPVAFLASRLNIGTIAAKTGNTIAAAPDMHALLTEAMTAWQQFDDQHADVNGGDLVDWFAGWRQRVADRLESL